MEWVVRRPQGGLRRREAPRRPIRHGVSSKQPSERGSREEEVEDGPTHVRSRDSRYAYARCIYAENASCTHARTSMHSWNTHTLRDVRAGASTRTCIWRAYVWKCAAGNQLCESIEFPIRFFFSSRLMLGRDRMSRDAFDPEIKRKFLIVGVRSITCNYVALCRIASVKF